MYKLHLMRIDLPISFEIYIHSDTRKTLYTFTEEILNEKFFVQCYEKYTQRSCHKIQNF